MKKKLPLGLTNKITIKDQIFIKTTTKTGDYFIDRKNEVNFYQQVQNIDFIKVPFQMKKQLNRRWKSQMSFYPETTTLNPKKYNLQIFKEVKNLIDQLHTLNINIKIFNPQEFLNLFIQKVGVITQLKKLEPKIQEIIFNYYNHQQQLVVSHNDLIPENFLIINQKMYLIDFEYVSYNHHLFDYASFMTEACNSKQAQQFKKILNLNESEEQELLNLMLYQNYLWAHWAKYMFDQTEDSSYAKIMKIKIKQALESKK